MATWHSVSRQVATPERTSAAPTPKSAAAPRPTPAQLLQQRLGNQGTAAFLSQTALQVSSQLNSTANQEHPAVRSSASSTDLSASAVSVGAGASVTSLPPRLTQQETASSVREEARPGTTSTPIAGQPGKSDASHQRVDRTKETGSAPTREASAQATPVAQHRAGTKSGESSKAAIAQAGPVSPTQAEPSGEKGPKLTPPSAREALAPLAATLHHRAAKARKHSAPRIPVASAQAAAIRPSTERTRAAAIQTVANLDAAKDKTGQFNKNEFREKLKKAIDATMQKPKTESEAKEVMKTGAKNASGLLKGEVTTQNQTVSGELQSATTDVRVSDQPEMKEVGLTPEPLGAPPAPVTTEAAVPPPFPAEQLDYSSDRAPTDKAMADAGVTKEQLEQGNEPEFKANLAARTDAEKHEAAAEQSYRKTEAGIREQTEHSAQTVVSHGLTNIHAARAAKIGKVVDQQNATREKHAAEHQRITDEINKIKNETRKDVNDVLTAMEKEGGDIFEKGLSDAEKAYEATFKEEKGGTWTWLTTWGSDWEDLIERSLATARGIYRVTVYQAIDRVADFVDAKLEEAKRKVSEGRSKVKSFVKGLDDSVRGFGETALKAVSADFDQMSGEIDQRRDSLVDKLTQQYKASYERMSAMEEKLREENKSLWQRIYDATVGLIKKILAFKDMLLNVLARAADAIGSIIAHPISFLGNLVDAGKLGFSNFVDHIGEHLKQGFMEWLFGAVAETGIQLPKNFDLAGILSLVLQVLGLTYSNIRSRAVKILGEKVVKALETAAEIFKILITKGPAGLWEYIKEKLGDLQAMVIDKIKSFIMEKVIMAGVTWIIGLLNPASAFFKACKAIYDIVMFFVSHGQQILALVNAIIDSISSIAKGAIGAAAAWVEKTLARTIPVIIGFLAALLGVGGISEKIKEIIEAIRKPINEAIDWVINKAVDLVKAVGGLLGFGKKDEVAKTDDPEHDAKVTAGLAAIDEEDAKRTKNGTISHEDAEQVAVKVKQDHPVFTSVKVVQGEDTWDYEYVGSGGRKKGAKAKDGDSDKPPLGSAVNDENNRKQAVVELEKIQNADAVSPAMVRLEEKTKGIFTRYKEEYRTYIVDQSNKRIQWPLSYLQGRSARKSGKVGEKNWLAQGFSGASAKAFYISENGSKRQRIPDGVTSSVIADVKDVKYQDFDAQLRDFYAIAKQRTSTGVPVVVYEEDGVTEVKKVRSFGLVVRGASHSEGPTKLSGPLESALDVVRDIITDKVEEEG
jgi:hypothetical protein